MPYTITLTLKVERRVDRDEIIRRLRLILMSFPPHSGKLRSVQETDVDNGGFPLGMFGIDLEDLPMYKAIAQAQEGGEEPEAEDDAGVAVALDQGPEAGPGEALDPDDDSEYHPEPEDDDLVSEEHPEPEEEDERTPGAGEDEDPPESMREFLDRL